MVLLTSSHSALFGGKNPSFPLGNHFYLCFGCSWLCGVGQGHVALEGPSLPWLQRWFLRCPCYLDRPNEAKGIKEPFSEPVETLFSPRHRTWPWQAVCGSDLRLVILPRSQSCLRARRVSGNVPHWTKPAAPGNLHLPAGISVTQASNILS